MDLQQKLESYYDNNKVLKYFVVDYKKQIGDTKALVNNQLESHKKIRDLLDHFALYVPQPRD